MISKKIFQENLSFVKNNIIKSTFGFDYERHFKNMLMQVIGLINFERIEKKVDPITRTKFKSTLSSLKSIRDSEAHTHIKGVTRRINSPSITEKQFNDVYEGLREFDQVIKDFQI